MSDPHQPSNNTHFNYRITKFFLNNSKLTILAFALLIVLGTASTFLLKTTGFPSPEVGFAQVQTVYPGASSETVAKEVTSPLEGAIKGVDGVETYNSRSVNSFSFISVTIEPNANIESVRSKIDSAVKGVKLPDGAEAPVVSKPEISGPDFIFSIHNSDQAKMFDVYQRLSTDLQEMPETSRIEPIVDLEKRVIVTVDPQKLLFSGVTQDQLSAQLKSFGESLPVVSDATLNSSSYSLVTTIPGNTIEDIENLTFTPASSSAPAQSVPAQVRLKDVATVNVDYQFVSDDLKKTAYYNEGKSTVLTPLIFSIRSVAGTDQAAYNQKIQDTIKSYDDAEFLIGKEVDGLETDKTTIIENYNVNDQNQEQVDEVVSGLIGGPLDVIDGPLSNIGWLLGGIQLVFLVMLAFVSWRAAIIAAISIPLSLVFSNIYLYLIGESLNTLVLFSLVLVIGLVVDPALVVLEAIQRKVDTGLKGNEAVLEAVKDVGNGLFLATLTNIIVFLPFGLISGIIGKIFAYIPLTVIPATIGSYIVPLVFLAWLGGLILKPSKNKSNDEEENLWPVAKWLIKLNERILRGSRFLRLAIVVVALIVPISITYYFFSTGQVKQVQFASNDNVDLMTLEGSFLPNIPKEERNKVTEEVLATIAKNENVLQVYPFENNFFYFIELKPALDRTEKSIDIAREIDNEIQNKFGESADNPKFFDVQVDLSQTGPPQTAYQVAIALKSDNLETLRKSSLEVGKTIQDKVCFTNDRRVVIDSECKDGKRIVTKVDDGYTNKENKVIEVVLDRQKLAEKQLLVPNAPLGILVNQQLKQQFVINDGESLSNISLDGEDVGIFVEKTLKDPETIDEVKNAVVFNGAGQMITLQDVAKIEEKTPKASIQRVKGQTVGIVQARLDDGYADQGTSALVTRAIVDYYSDTSKTSSLGLEDGAIEEYSEGGTAENAQSFQDLIIALLLAIVLTYVVLAVFFQSFTQPLVILYTIPLTFIGMIPALAWLGGGQIGFLEIIGIIILVGIVENVAIFLIDSARQKITHDNWDEKRAISYAAGVRLRAVLMTKFTAIASLAPLAFLSVFYRSISIVIIFGLLSSGFISLITTPILFIFFRWLSKQFSQLSWYNKILIYPLFWIYIPVLAYKDRQKK